MGEVLDAGIGTIEPCYGVRVGKNGFSRVRLPGDEQVL